VISRIAARFIGTAQRSPDARLLEMLPPPTLPLLLLLLLLLMMMMPVTEIKKQLYRLLTHC